MVWNINSAAAGGGVAEMLNVLLAYVRGFGIDSRWLVIEGDTAFFQVTKRLHNRLQPVAERLCPAVGQLRERLTALHPAGVLMSGSGSTVFALCRHPAEALSIARGLRARREVGDRLRVCSVRSCI